MEMITEISLSLLDLENRNTYWRTQPATWKKSLRSRVPFNMTSLFRLLARRYSEPRSMADSWKLATLVARETGPTGHIDGNERPL